MLESDGNAVQLAKNSSLQTAVELSDLSVGKSLRNNHFDVELKRAHELINDRPAESTKKVSTTLGSISVGDAKIAGPLSDKKGDALLPKGPSSDTPDHVPSRALEAAAVARTSLNIEGTSTKPMSVNRDVAGFENLQNLAQLDEDSPVSAPDILKLSTDNPDSTVLSAAASTTRVSSLIFDDSSKPIKALSDVEPLSHTESRANQAASVNADPEKMGAQGDISAPPTLLSANTQIDSVDSSVVSSNAVKAALSETQAGKPAIEGRAIGHAIHSVISAISAGENLSTSSKHSTDKTTLEQTIGLAETADSETHTVKPVGDHDPRKMDLSSGDDIASKLERQSTTSLLSQSGSVHPSRILGTSVSAVANTDAEQVTRLEGAPTQLVGNGLKPLNRTNGDLRPLVGSAPVNSIIELNADSDKTLGRAFVTNDRNATAPVESVASSIASAKFTGTDIRLPVYTMSPNVVTKNSIDATGSAVDMVELDGEQKANSAVTNVGSDEVTVTNLQKKALSSQSDALAEVVPSTLARSVSGKSHSVDSSGLQAIATPQSVTPSNVYHVTTNGTITANPSSQNTGLTDDIASAPRTVLLSQPGDDRALVENVRWAVSEKLSRVTVNVTPANLGPITVSVDVENQSMSVSILANNAVAKDALDSLLPRVREHFTNEGYQQVNVDVSSQQERKNSLNNRSHHPLMQPDAKDVESFLDDASAKDGPHTSYQRHDSNSLIDTYV